MSLDWQDTEDAIVGWLEAISDPSPMVLWANQNGPYPEYPFFTLRVTSLIPVGREQTELTDTGTNFDSTVRRWYVMNLSVQSFAGKDVIGSSSSRAMLTKAMAYLSLDSIQESLIDAGLGVIDTGSIIDLTSEFKTGYLSQSACEVRFYVSETAQEFVDYILNVVSVGEYEGGLSVESDAP